MNTKTYTEVFTGWDNQTFHVEAYENRYNYDSTLCLFDEKDDDEVKVKAIGELDKDGRLILLKAEADGFVATVYLNGFDPKQYGRVQFISTLNSPEGEVIFGRGNAMPFSMVAPLTATKIGCMALYAMSLGYGDTDDELIERCGAPKWWAAEDNYDRQSLAAAVSLTEERHGIN